MKKIDKLDINLFPEQTSEDEYNKKKSKFIANYTTYKSNLLFSWFENDPVLGEAKWNEMYPMGYKQWAGDQINLTAYGQKHVIDKINELVDFVNKSSNK